MIPQARPHTDALLAALRAAGLTVGDATGTGLTAPYSVLYTDEGSLDGSLGDRFSDLTMTAVLHSFGAGRQQAQWGVDKARAAVLAGVSVPGRNTLYVTQLASQPVTEDTDVTPSLFLAIDVYRFATTPGSP
ncbi:MAG TPA: hypothetical protein VFJ19_09340 [Nocardioidaceae bacterium]|nr:hypothetical protein [Nocardioidaceae bacterium]